MTTIRFDQSSASWSKIKDHNLFFVVRQIDYLTEILRHRGYVYLNTVYEHFGVAWNPDNENVCYRDADSFFIGYHYDTDSEDGDGYVISIN